MGERTQKMRVFVEDGKLMSQPQGQRARRLLRQGDHEFRPEEALELSLAFTLESGRAKGVTLSNGSRTQSGRRRP